MNNRTELINSITKAIIKRDNPDKSNEQAYADWIYSLLSNKPDKELIKIKEKILK